MKKKELIKRINKVSILQHDSSDCGAACLASAVNFFGGYSTIENIRSISGTTLSGTTMLGLFQAAKSYGLIAEGYEATVDDITDYKGLLILHVTMDHQQEHYINVYGYHDERFLIWDPSKGIDFKNKEELYEVWKSKKCLGVSAGESFEFSGKSKYKTIHWLREILSPDIALLLISLAIGAAISVLGLVMAVFSQKLIDRILPLKDFKLLIISVILVMVLLISRLALNVIREQLLLFQGKVFNIRIVDSFFGSLLYLPKSFFDSRKTGDFVGRLNDTARIQRVVNEFVSIYLIDIMIIIVSVIALFFYSSPAAIYTIICIPVFFTVVHRWSLMIISSHKELMSAYALSESFYIDSIRGITEIRSMRWQDIFRQKNRQIYTSLQDKILSLGKIRIRLGFITGTIGTFYLVGLLLYSSLRVMNSEMSEGELIGLFSIGSVILPAILNLSLISIPVNETRVAIERMFEFSSFEKEENQVTTAQEVMKIGQLGIKNVSFRFPGQRLLLNKISLEIKKGSIISLVGECGCGKSTVANIIMRFYKPEAGDIKINNITDYKDVDLDKWREMVAIIPQEIHIFNGTILQNLVPDLSENKLNYLMKMISAFGMTGFIESFPAGLLTVAGEEGINLSGGQRQLIGFLRAMISKPDILIIDEGTSNMDRNTESIITDLLLKLKQDTGIMIISHRMNLVRKLSDFVYELQNNTIKRYNMNVEFNE